MKRKLTCIVCPLGCELVAEFDGDKVNSVCGNTCTRGEKYAIEECVYPKRTLTTTIRCGNGSVVAVKTDKAIPKDKIAECMKIANNAVVSLPICVGDIIIENVFGANVVATQNKR